MGRQRPTIRLDITDIETLGRIVYVTSRSTGLIYKLPESCIEPAPGCVFISPWAYAKFVRDKEKEAINAIGD